MAKLPKDVVSVVRDNYDDYWVTIESNNDLTLITNEWGESCYDAENNASSLCYKDWKQVTGITLRKGSKPIRVRISAEIVK